jgi:hypothetical protein
VPAVSSDSPQFADNRPALSARFEELNDVAVDPNGIVWVADGSHVRMYSPVLNTVSTACSDRGAHQQPVEFEEAVAIAVSEEKIFVADAGANKIILLTAQPD